HRQRSAVPRGRGTGPFAVSAGRAAADPAPGGPPGAGRQPLQRGPGVGGLRPALAGGGDHRPPAPAMADALVARPGDAQPRRDPLASPDPAHRRRPPPASATMRAMHIETLGSGPDLVLIHGWALHGGVFA